MTLSRRPFAAREADAAFQAAVRRAEERCRRAFSHQGQADHAERCICEPPCSRDYDPLPYPEARPHPPELFEGTGIAALYQGGMSSAQAADLAGWNIRPGSRPE